MRTCLRSPLYLREGVNYEPERAADQPASFDPSEHKFGNCRCLIQANSLASGGLSSGLTQVTHCRPEILSHIPERIAHVLDDAYNHAHQSVVQSLVLRMST